MTEVFTHLWQSTVFAALITAAALLCRRNPASTRFWLWMAASFKFLMPFSLLYALGALAPTPVPSRAAALRIERITNSFTPAVIEELAPPATGGPIDWELLLTVVWAIGVAVQLVRWFAQWHGIRRGLRTAVALPIAAPIPVLSVDTALEPGVFGIFRPRLLLPRGIEGLLTNAEWDAILAHEMCHVRRRDNLTAALHMLVESVFWFYPPVRWVGAKLLAERERACDEEVLRLGNSPSVYACGILRVCESYVESPVPCAAGVTGAELRQRIGEILNASNPLQLSPVRRIALALVCLAGAATPVVLGILNAPRVRAQAVMEKNNYHFEVASIRPNTGEGRGMGVETGAAVFRATNIPLHGLIQFAYGVQDYQITGGPGWLRDDRFDILAKYERAEEGAVGALDQKADEKRNERIRAALRDLLADRFQLRLHQESKELPLYALVIDKGGPKLKVSVDGHRSTHSNQNNGTGRLTARGVTMASLATSLSGILRRPVRDETGLREIYDFIIDWTDNQSAEGSGPTMFSAVREQLGLRLESKKGPVTIHVVDNAAKPSEN